MSSIQCCYNCAKRQIGCHGKCEIYLEAKAKNDEQLAEKRKQCEYFEYKRVMMERSRRGTLHPLKEYMIHGKIV